MTLNLTESGSLEAERAELEAVVQSDLFTRAPTLAHLLSYLCEKTFNGESGQIKEYSIAVDVLARSSEFDQDADSIVRVQANRLRKRLAEYYAGPGASHSVHISIPVGQYVPHFERVTAPEAPANAHLPPTLATDVTPAHEGRRWHLLVIGAVTIAAVLVVLAVFALRRIASRPAASYADSRQQAVAPPVAGLPTGDELRILAGSNRAYVDRAGKLWSGDRNFSGGTAVRANVGHVWRTLDEEIYRSSRQGDFSYDIPLKPGSYELRLHFAETFYGPEDQGGGGEGSRVIAIRANDQPLLAAFDVVADAGGSRTADVKVFTDVQPAADGVLHLSFSSVHGGRAMLSAIEILPGARAHMRPVRIVTRDSAYYSNDSRWWSPDNYFKGGQLAIHEASAAETDDPELYGSERWGHFSYAIPAAPGRYTVILHFVERRFGPENRDKYVGPPHESGATIGGRLFNVFCNGKAVLREFDLFREGGENRPVVRRIAGVEPNAQGKLVLDFVPLKDYATVTAIEVVPE